MHNTDMRNSVPGTFYHYLKTVFWDVTPCNFVLMDRRFGEEYLMPPSYNQIPLAKVRGSGFHSIVSAYLPDSEASHLN